MSSGTSIVVGDKSCRRVKVGRARALASNHHGTRGTLSGTRGTLGNYPVSGAAAPSLPSTRAGGQDDGSYTNSLKLSYTQVLNTYLHVCHLIRTHMRLNVFDNAHNKCRLSLCFVLRFFLRCSEDKNIYIYIYVYAYIYIYTFEGVCVTTVILAPGACGR